MTTDRRIYGLLAEFDRPDDLLEAAHKAREAGYTRMEAYTPFPVHGLASALGFHHTRLPLIVLIGGIIGAVGGFFMQWYANVVSYPINIAGLVSSFEADERALAVDVLDGESRSIRMPLHRARHVRVFPELERKAAHHIAAGRSDVAR